MHKTVMARSQPEEIPAATLVVFRHAAKGGPPEILMVVRSRKMSFAGGMAVFPGGRVDAADHDLAASLDHGLDEDEAAHRIAAIRETIEETGLAVGIAEPVDAGTAAAIRTDLLEQGAIAPVLDRRKLSLDLDALVPFARWCPRGMEHSRIFDTRFYLADLGTGDVEIAIDQTENTRLFWTTAKAALDAADTGEISLIFPTRRNLERLALFATFADARAQATAIPATMIVPEIADRNGKPTLTIPADAGYPVTQEPLDRAVRG